MQRVEAIARLKALEPRLRGIGASSLYLHGSTARDEAKPSSDLDIFLEIASEMRFTLLDLVETKHAIEDDIGIKADVTTRDSLHLRMRDEIEREAVRIF